MDKKDSSMRPFFSIITTCFNSEKTIERTIQSVLGQSYRKFEYILIDGNSTDNTLKIIQRYAHQYPDIIRYVSESDMGIYDGINKGIRIALNDNRGQLIGIINSDDFYEKDALQVVADEFVRQKEKLENQRSTTHEIYYGAIREIREERERRIWMNSHEFLQEAMIAHPGCFITADVYRDYGLYTLEYRSASDYEFMLRMRNLNSVTFHPIYHIIANFSVGGFSDSKIGDHETKKIKYLYGYLSKKRYWLHLCSYYGRFWRK